jgi:hypothetical protein
MTDDDAGEESSDAMLSSRRIGSHFGLSSIKTNLLLAELGWIEKYVKGWIPSDRGTRLGANVKDGSKAPYVVWPASILTHPALVKSVEELTGKDFSGCHRSRYPETCASSPPPKTQVSEYRDTVAPKQEDFRTKFRGDYCTQDGHFVKSRAEALIDNWLYQQQIAHAYERRLPIEEDCYCDFYIAAGKGVYIEYWGRESDPKYRARMAEKRAIYAKHGLNLIELGDAELERLDDVLPRLLLRYGIESI